MATPSQAFTGTDVPRRGNPERWIEPDRLARNCAGHGVSTEGWQSGATAPDAPGWYERLFTDGAWRHHWNGEHWSAQEGGPPHWRQVGDYPCWRPLPPARTPMPDPLRTARQHNEATAPMGETTAFEQALPAVRESNSLRTCLGAIHARLNCGGPVDEAAVRTILDEIEREIPALARLRNPAHASTL